MGGGNIALPVSSVGDPMSIASQYSRQKYFENLELEIHEL